MELIAIGFLLGIVTCIIFVGAGMVYAERMASKNEKKGDRNDKDSIHQSKDDKA